MALARVMGSIAPRPTIHLAWTRCWLWLIPDSTNHLKDELAGLFVVSMAGSGSQKKL